MSSIIKALKKLDDDAPRPNETVYRNQNVNIRKAVLGRAKQSHAYQKWIIASCITGVVIVVGFVVFPMKQKTKRPDFIAANSQTNRIPRQAPTPTTIKPKKKKAYSAPSYWEGSTTNAIDQDRKKEPLLPPTPPTEKVVELTTSDRKTPEPQTVSVAPEEVSAQSKEPPFSDLVDEGTLITPSSSIDSSSQESEAQEAAIEDPSLESFTLGPPPESKATLELQALVWSDDPGNRFAVVDGRILKEGQAFGGVRVLKINWDSVVLEFEGRQWQLIQY